MTTGSGEMAQLVKCEALSLDPSAGIEKPGVTLTYNPKASKAETENPWGLLARQFS